MKNNIRNYDKNNNLHGVQITYHPNDNISCIENWYHGIYHGYKAWFKSDNSIDLKLYYNMGKWVYSENYFHKQIKIHI